MNPSLAQIMTELQKGAALRSIILVMLASEEIGEDLSISIKFVSDAKKTIEFNTKGIEHMVFQNPDTTYLKEVLSTLDIPVKYWLCVEYYRMSTRNGPVGDKCFDVVLEFLTAMDITQDHYIEILELAYKLE